jgi:hypothetical protein
MTLASTISAGNLTNIRADAYHALQCVVVVPDAIVVQFTPSAAPSTSVYADITVGTVASGSMSDVKSFQTVIYSTTTDYQATELYRTYVRKVSGTTTLYISQCAQSLTTSIYVTVLNQYDVFEKPGTVRNGTRYNDYDVAFRRLLPVETALPSAIVLTDGTTAWSPTASPQEMDNDATSTFTHAWESSNSNDTLDSGGTTNNPSWTLQANAFRWIRYTGTDSNGNAILRVIAVWTVPKDLSSVLILGFIGQSNDVANISYAQGQGWSCTLPAISGISDIPQGQMVCVFSVETYNATRGSIESHIDFVGYLGDETTVTGGDEQYGVISETRFIVNGFNDLLLDTPLSPIDITSTSSPSSWDSIENPTPARVATYLLTEFTTLGHLCGIKVPSDHTDFIGDNNILDSDIDMVYDAISYQADAFDGIIQYSRDGVIDITRNLVQLDDTARNAADTVCAMTPTDWLSFEVTVSPRPTLRYLVVYAGVLNTTSNDYDIYRAIVPPVPDNRGVDEQERPNIIITTNSSDADARTELAQRSANLYAALNPTDTIRVTLKDEWRFLQPDVGTWYTFTIGATDTVRGWAYDSNTRWQLLDISYSSNNETGRKEVQATFRKETSNTGANIEVSRVVIDPANEINAVPGTLPPFSGGDLGLTDGEWFDGFDTSPASDPAPPGADCEFIGFRPKDGVGAETDQSALTSEAVAYQVSGFGKLQTAEDVLDDFAGGAQDWYSNQVGDHYAADDEIKVGDSGSHTGGLWTYGDVTRLSDNTISRICQIDYDLGASKKITSLTVTYNLTKGTLGGGNPVFNWYVSDDNVTWTLIEGLLPSEVSNGTGLTYTYENTTGLDARYLSVFVRSSQLAQNGSCAITQIEYTTADVYGDALYQWVDENEPTAYGSGDGLLFEAAQPLSIPSYSEDHAYSLYDNSVDSGPLIFDFETPYTLAQLDNWSIQILVCFLGVP